MPLRPVQRFSAVALALVFLVAHGVFGATASAQPESAAPEQLRLNVTELTPRVVTPEAGQLTVRATITNVGERSVTDIVARLQFGGRLSTESDLTRALADPPPANAASTDWVDVPPTLRPGQSAPLRLSVPIETLPLTSPGVYPLLVNVNGTPAEGSPARLAAVDLLLPVIEPPAEVAPTGVSLLWPIAAEYPRVIGTPVGGPVLLSDDGLADALKPGGRLDALVAAAASRSDQPAFFGSICFAIDPDLIETVDAMRRGYEVQTPNGPVPGTAREHAARWLESLRTLVAGHCVIQTPFGGAELAALPKIDTPVDLMANAVDGSVLDRVLDVRSQPGVLWPEGAVDAPSASAAANVGVTTLITKPARAAALPADKPRTLAFDPLVARALTTNLDQPNVATQNGLAAIAFRGGLGDETSSSPVLVAPPHGWSAPVSELTSMLDALSTFQAAGMLHPAPLTDLLAANGVGAVSGNGASPAGDVPDVRPSARSATTMPADLLAALSTVEATSADFQSAMSVDPTRQVAPATLIEPLHNAVLRATAWRTRPDRVAAAEVAADQLDALLGQVTVETPAQPVSLGSGSSPLPVTLSNALPVSINVRVKLENAAGLRPEPMQDQLLAGSQVGRWIPAETLRSGRFNVGVSLETPGGTKLGHPARLEMTSSELGVVMVVVTSIAGALLVLLAARRIVRRIRDARRPHPDVA